MTATRSSVNAPQGNFTACFNLISRDGERQVMYSHGGVPEAMRVYADHIRRQAGQRDEVIALGGERLSIEPAVDSLNLEPREPEHQLQLSTSEDTNGELVHPLVLEGLPLVQLVEEAHSQEL